jgi:uncharacterized protein (DUF927 family)
MRRPLRLPASSTGKGLQDRAIQYPDLPIFLDELQQLAEQNPIVASDAVYFLANGQRRVTSSRAQTSVGGEARHGVGFYAAEAPVPARPERRRAVPRDRADGRSVPR